MADRGLFIVFEGIDGSGKSTQMHRFLSHIEELSKYIDVLRTHEPWRSEEIKRKLAQDRETYSDGLKMAKLYVEDRARHAEELIIPNLRNGVFVVSDRYSLSTCAYQQTQGVPLRDLIKLHEINSLPTPDITFLIDTPAMVAMQRIKARGMPVEKFERDLEFTRKLVTAYQTLAVSEFPLFGKVVCIDGQNSVEKMAEEIRNGFKQAYNSWKANI